MRKEILWYTNRFYIWSIIIEEDSSGITVEIDLFEHRKLLEDLTNFFIKNWEIENSKKKIGHGYFVGNVFLTIKIYNGF